MKFQKNYFNFLDNVNFIEINLSSEKGTLKVMAKNPHLNKLKRQKSDPIVPVLAKKHGLSPRQIRMIRDGERSNDAVFNDYMWLREWWKTGAENVASSRLLEKVRELVPFENN